MSKSNRLEVPSDSVKVSRKDLFKSGGDNDEFVSDVDDENVSYVPDFDFEEINRTDVDKAPEESQAGTAVVENEEEGYFFPLFGRGGDNQVNADKAATITESVTKVIIAENNDFDSAILKERPESYYLYRPDPLQRSIFQDIGVSGGFVIERSTIPLPGMRMPWKVVDYSALAEKTKVENRKRRARPGKKTREQRKLNPRKRVAPSLPVYGSTRTYGSSNLTYNTAAAPAKVFKRSFHKPGRGGSNSRGRGAFRGRGGSSRGRGK